MPLYDYTCSACKHTFELLVPMNDRDKACTEKCPACKKKKIERGVGSNCVIAFDTTVRPGTQFKETIERIKKHVPKEYRAGLDRSLDVRGTVYGRGKH